MIDTPVPACAPDAAPDAACPDTRPDTYQDTCPPAGADLLPGDPARRSHLRLWAGGALLGCAAPLVQGQTRASAVERFDPPVLRLITPPGQQPIELQRVEIQAELVGRAVATRIEIHLFNPNTQVLEAELQLPLLDGQVVTGFALDIQGELRAAVPVEKARGREVFEAIVRRGVDPALLESTQGNHHKLRVYPIAPRGVRRVVLHLSETLGAAAGGPNDDLALAPWRLPLRLGARVGQLELSVRCVGVAAAAVSAEVGAERLALQDQGDGSALLRWSRTGQGGAQPGAAQADRALSGAGAGSAAAELRVQLPRPASEPGAAVAGAGRSGAIVSTERRVDQTCFYAELALPAAWRTGRPRPRPAQITLWWDASGSGALRDHTLELAWLDAWLRRVGDTVVQLVELRDEAQAPQRFELSGGRWDGLRARLQAMAYDGASRLGELRPLAGSTLGLLFSDGLGNYGARSTPALAEGAPTLPVLTVSASADADLGALRRLAQASGGACIDLLTLDLPQALALAQTERCRLVGLGGRGVTELEGAGQLPEAGRLCFAGLLTAAQAEVELQVLLPGGERRILRVPVQAPPARPAEESGRAGKSGAKADGSGLAAPAALPQGGVAGLRWAQMRLARLQADPQANRAAMRRLGQQFGLVTPETSLIVLETLADYVTHDIEPPPHWRAEWLRGRERVEPWRRAGHQGGLPAEWSQRQRWWATDFTHPLARAEPARPAQQPLASAPVMAAAPAPLAAARRDFAPARPSAAGGPWTDTAKQAAQADLGAQSERARGTERSAADLGMAQVRREAETAQTLRAGGFNSMAMAPAGVASTLAVPPPEPGQTVIALQAWQPDSAALQRLRAAPPAQRYAIFLDERPAYTRSSAFFLDMAEIFLGAGQTELGLRIVSNLAELALENRQLLRILAFRLLAAGQWRTALPVLERVLALAPDEAQSWRDLALACERAGQQQRAVELLWVVGTRVWSRSAPGLAEIALAELGAIAARHPGLDLQAIDPACRQPMPVALRVLLSWDSDNTDIDLWVIDPDGETCSYQRRLTRQGGRLTADNTEGYGPEEFLLRVARPGVYTVKANFYGHHQQVLAGATTVMVQLSTDWASPAQQDQQRVLRLRGERDVVMLGQFSVAGPAAAASGAPVR